MAQTKVLLGAVIFIGVVSIPAWCLQCYECNSRNNPRCGAAFTATDARVACDPVPADNSTRGAEVCFVAVTSGVNITGISRACSRDGAETCDLLRAEVLLHYGTVQSCRACSSDLCNQAAGLHGALTAAMALPLLLLRLSS